jgi:hypothetical protein
MLVVSVGEATAEGAPSEPVGQPAEHIGCSVNVERLAEVWVGIQAWATREKDTGDALADAMKLTVGSSDPSDLEVLEMQKEGAKEFLAGVRDFRAGQMKDDLDEITLLGSRIRGILPSSHRSLVKGRIAKIRSLYREYWYNAFTAAYASGYQSLMAAKLEGWYSATTGLPALAATAGREFQPVYRGLSKVC